MLLADADLRRPGISKTLSLKSTAGLSTILSGVDRVEDAIVPFPQLPNLQVLPAGPIPPNPVELLGSTVKDHIARWRNEYDHIIIDTPPCLSVTDSVVLSVDADRVILVARSGQTPKAALRRASDLLTQVNARVMGVVLNAFDLRSADGYYYYYYYGSKYASRYDQQSEEEQKLGRERILSRPNQVCNWMHWKLNSKSRRLPLHPPERRCGNWLWDFSTSVRPRKDFDYSRGDFVGQKNDYGLHPGNK